MPKLSLSWLLANGVISGGGVPSIALYDSGNSVAIANGDSSPSTSDGTDFGTSPVGTTVTKTYTIRNTGTAPLSVSAISVPSNYTQLTSLPLSILAGATATFQIRLNAGAIAPSPNATYAGNVTITSNSTQNSSWVFAITGIIEVAFLLRDDLNSGSVAAGTRTATHVGQTLIADSGGLLSINTDLVQAAGGGANNPNVSGVGSHARSAGRLMAIKVIAGNGGSWLLGWSSGSDGKTYTHRVYFNNTTLNIAPNFPVLDASFNEACYWGTVVMRAAGAYYFVRGGKWGHWNLIHIERSGTATPLYPAWSNTGGSVQKRMSDLLVPDVLWTPTAIVSDDFNRADGAIGTSDSYEGGTNTAWSNAVGTAAISSNALAWSAITTIGLVTLEANNHNVSVIGALTRTVGSVGLVACYADTNNYLIAYHDGTNVKVDKVVGGSTTNLISKAIAYSAGADLLLHIHYGEVSGTYNNVHLSSSPASFTDAALLAATKVGCYSTLVGNTIDNFIAWPRGSAGEYNSYLSVYAQRLETEKKYIAFDGDSLTVGTLGTAGITESYPYVCMNTLGRNLYDYCNYAVSGQTIVNLLSDDEYTVGAIAPSFGTSYCVVWIGTNDLIIHTSAATVYNNIVSYIQAQQTAGYTRVLVLTILVRNNITGADETSRQTINSNLISNAASLGITVVDVASNANLDDFNDTTYFNADKTHLKAAGYAVVAGMVATAIQAL